MIQFVSFHKKELFPGSMIVNNRAYETAATRGKCTHLQAADCFDCHAPFLEGIS